ncbi:MAG TPA: YciI family protein [Cellvibrio sp.]|nr:YciI family protein [Cellvibrio sp.]
MKFVCIGYFSPSLSASHTTHEIETVMEKCKPHLDQFYATGNVILDVGVDNDSYRIFREKGIQHTQEVLLQADKMIGSITVIDAENAQDALEIARLHPAVQIAEGEYLGWEIKVQPLHHYTATVC